MLKLGWKKKRGFLNLISASEDNMFVSNTQTGYIYKDTVYSLSCIGILFSEIMYELLCVGI